MEFYYVFIPLKLKINSGRDSFMSTLQKLNGKSADEILNQYSDADSIPIDIAKIAQNIGIKLGSIDFSKLEQRDGFKEVVEKSGHIHGAVLIQENEILIVYNNSLQEDASHKDISEDEKKKKLLQRQRFTIAHEIAHCCLHMKKGQRTYIEYRTEQLDPNNQVEREANIFAGELLMPLKFLKAICQAFGNCVRVSDLSALFEVSRHVVEARINHLKDIGELKEVIFTL